MRKLLLAVAASFGLSGLAQAADLRFDGYPDLDSAVKDLAPAYEAAHPGVKIVLTINKHEDHHKKITMNLATGSGAGDVVALDVGYIGALVNNGGLEDLGAAPYNAGELQQNFVPYAWEQGKGFDGKQYAIPVDIGPGVMYYRQDILEKTGMKIEDVIKDWDSYIEYGQKLKPMKVKLIADAADVALLILHTGAKEGESRFFDANGKSLITSERFVRAFTIAKKIRDEGLDGRIEAWSNEWHAGFRDGTVATQLSGCWLLGHLQNTFAPNTAGLWRVSNLPDGIFGSWGGSFLVIPKQSKNKEAAWEFIKYWTTNVEAQVASMKKIGSFPVVPAAYTDPAFDEEIAFLGGQQARHLFADVAKKVHPVSPKKGDLIAEEVVFKGALREVLNEGKDIKTALAEAERLVMRRLK